MSRTYRDMHPHNRKHFWNQYWSVDRVNAPWDNLAEVPFEMSTNYSRNPGWYDHLFWERPNRRKTRQLCHQIEVQGYDRDYIFPHKSKGTEYYW